MSTTTKKQYQQRGWNPFNLLRVVNNDIYPVFFELEGRRYILKIEADDIEEAQLIDFIDLTEDERLKVLRWRNHESIRTWMYQTEQITLDEHRHFIKSLERKKDKQYLLVKTEQGDLGVIDFVNIDVKQRSCDFGLYANPETRISGAGRQLVALSIAYVFKVLNLQTLKLEVFSGNKRAIKLYKKFKFEMTGHKVVNDQKVLCMQLHNETG